MTAADRLAQIEARANAATDGPWLAEYSGEQGNCVVPHDAQSTREAVAITRLYRQVADAEFIAHARTDVPRLIAALRAVLDLHRPMTMYEHEDVCEDTSDEHREERHCEGVDIGEYYCLDLPTGITLCSECSRDLDFDGRDYPCPTVRAVEAALAEVAP